MLTNYEILNLIKNGEDSTVEFKLEDVHSESLAQEIVAFANVEGGIIIFGVNDSGDVVGITRNDLEEWATNICRQGIEPPIIPVINNRGVKATTVVRTVEITG